MEIAGKVIRVINAGKENGDKVTYKLIQFVTIL